MLAVGRPALKRGCCAGNDSIHYSAFTIRRPAWRCTKKANLTNDLDMKKITLRINKPCSEEWTGMQPGAEGRFCRSCAKTVVDFTLMSDAELLDFFRRASGPVCGRLTASQLDRELVRPGPTRSWSHRLFALVLPAWLLGCRPGGRSEVTTGTIKIAQSSSEAQPFANPERPAKSPSSQDAQNGGRADPAQSRELPSEKCKPQQGRERPASFLAAGDEGLPQVPTFDTLSAQGQQPSAVSSIKPEPLVAFLGDVSVGVRIEALRPALPLIRIIRDTVFRKFLVAPNPVRRGQQITIIPKGIEAGSYIISILSAGGEIILNTEQTIGEAPLPLALPQTASGTYYLSLFSKKNAKSHAQKLVVQ